MENAMDMDETVAKKATTEDCKSEEGELSDEDLSFQPTEEPDGNLNRPIEKSKGEASRVESRVNSFITGVDVFGKEEQARLVERAKRFGLDPSQSNLLTENQLQKLYKSLGVKEGDDKEFRFDSIRMHGTEAMSTQDVFEYFKDYAPASIEWIDDESCNVVWVDNLSAIRALLGLSKPIKNLLKFHNDKVMPQKISKKIKSKVEDKDDSDSDVIMIEDSENNPKLPEKQWEEEVANDPEAIDAYDLNLEIPPGMWRKGNTHPNSDGILLRFCSRLPESKNEDEPKRLPQPVFGVVGLLSKSRKQRIKDGLLVRPKMFEDDMGDDRDFVLSSDDDGKNPWGTLAKSWSNIDRARKPPLPQAFDKDIFGGLPLPPPLPHMMGRVPPPMPLPPHSILSRVGMRPSSSKDTSHGRFSRFQSRSPSPEELPLRPTVHSRLHGKRRHVKDSDSEDSAFSDKDSSDADNWTRKSKIPRMRMYADEEEVKAKKRTKLQARRKLSPKRHNSRTSIVHPNRSIDLRSRLMKDSSPHRDSREVRRRTHRAESHRSKERHAPERYNAKSKPKLRSVASSVWTRLSQENNIKVKQEEESEDSGSSCSESDQSSLSSSSEGDHITVTTKVGKSSSEDEEEYDNDNDEINERSSTRGDLRSRLNGASTSSYTKPVRSTISSSIFRKHSPLRIEIDNDEYYES